MAPGVATLISLLLVASTTSVSVRPPEEVPGSRPDFRNTARRLMKACHRSGHPRPTASQLHAIFTDSELLMKNGSSHPSTSLLPDFFNTLQSFFPPDKVSVGRVPLDKLEELKNKMQNCTDLLTIIKLLNNSSCYIEAVLAPLSWRCLDSQDTNMDSGEFKHLLWAAKPALLDATSKTLTLPVRVWEQNMEEMTQLLQELYGSLLEDQRTQVGNWEKEQIVQNYFNCTLRNSSDPRAMWMLPCKSSLKWLDSKALVQLGPYLSHLTPADIELSPKETLCQNFQSAKIQLMPEMKPGLRTKFLQMFQQCFSGREFAENLDKLGPLACFYDNALDLSPKRSEDLLAQLVDCDNPEATKLKKRLLKAVMSNPSWMDSPAVRQAVTLLSPQQLSTMDGSTFREVIKSLRPKTRWTKSQLFSLVKHQLGGDRCKKVSGEDLMALGSVVEGLPGCILKQVKAHEVLKDTEGLRNISARMKRGQLKAMLQGLQQDMEMSELVQKLPPPLLSRVSLDDLDKAVTSWEQIEQKPWSRSQAALLVRKMRALRQVQFRRLGSLLQGITCKMIHKLSEAETQELMEAIKETPQWLPKALAVCAARKLFASLEKQRHDYFRTVSEEELADIPSSLILHLPPAQVSALPTSVCNVLLAPLEAADLGSSLPGSPSRLALARKALLCLGQGRNLSALTAEDVSRMGALLCELPPALLRLTATDVLMSTLPAVASCQNLPLLHRKPLVQVVLQTFGDPSDWSEETMESVGLLILLDDNLVSALTFKPWMKEVLIFLRSRLRRPSDALRRKIFQLTVASLNISSEEPRRRRAADDGESDTEGFGDIGAGVKLTSELMEGLGEDNIYWTAEQLETMSNETFVEAVETLGGVPGYVEDQLAVLREKALQAFGPTSQMNEGTVVQLGCISKSFFAKDLENLPFSLDGLADLAHCGWNHLQLGSVWKAVLKRHNLTAALLGAAELVSLDRFLCGLSLSEISQLNLQAFKDAVGSLGDLRCRVGVARQLKDLAVSVFGSLSNWTEAQVAALGNIAGALDEAELLSLEASVLSFLSTSSIPLFPPQTLAALSPAKLQALGPENAAAVTGEQRAWLSRRQRDALERAEAGEGPPSPEVKSRAPSVNMEGFSALLKPLLFLLVGFLLL